MTLYGHYSVDIVKSTAYKINNVGKGGQCLHLHRSPYSRLPEVET